MIIADITKVTIDDEGPRSIQERDRKKVSQINRNVLYEIGMAHALEKAVILISQNDPTEFDFRNIRTIKYDLSHLDVLDGKIPAALRSTCPELFQDWRCVSS